MAVKQKDKPWQRIPSKVSDPQPELVHQWAPIIGTVFGLCVLSTVSFLAVGSVATFSFWWVTAVTFSAHEQIRTAVLVVWVLAQVLIYLVAVRIFAQSWLASAAARMSSGARRRLGRTMVFFGWGISFVISAIALGSDGAQIGSIFATELGPRCAALIYATVLCSPLLAFGAIGWFFARFHDSPLVTGTPQYAYKVSGDQAKEWLIVSVVLSFFLILYALNSVSFH